MEATLYDLKNRRSVRKYKTEQIKKEELEKILEAGTYAPTGMGIQSPKIVVVQDKETISKLSKLNAKFEPGSEEEDTFYGAPTVLIVLADKSRPTYVEDGSLVMGNLLNAAYALGVGSCWIHRAKEMFEAEEGKELLKAWGLDAEKYAGIGNCILGYADEEAAPAEPRKSDYIVFV
ncbi:nitroreductase [Mediterraneibacter sp. NSJ-55]|uniref:Nitroreductase n=1 Tax=Mediterraneibacter hominis TaxID=2763054 RepID=A0A923LF27_9FIRM|nr:nitroreductase [Mediterraneibacter hominis]MBC5687431.1 nitroreductase [Mediterraneibacter hominis]